MTGYICIAMLEDPPYNMIVGMTEHDPDDWCDELPLPSHLLYFQGFKSPKNAIKQLIKQLNDEGIDAKVDKAFSALPHQVIGAFIAVRDEALKANQLVNEVDDVDYEEGERLYDLAREYEEGSDKIIPDLKKAFKYYQQAAQLEYEPAYTALSYAYLNGDGVKKDLNEALQWAYRAIDTGSISGYSCAAECFEEANMKPQLESLWGRCFREMAGNKDLPDIVYKYVRQVRSNVIAAAHSPEITSQLFEIAQILRQRNAKLYKETIKWLEQNDIDKTIPSVKPPVLEQVKKPLQHVCKFTVQVGIAEDTETGLMWLRFAYGQTWKNGMAIGNAKKANWNNAFEIAEQFNQQGGYYGHRDWRLPTIDELKTLIDPIKDLSGNCIDTDVFPEGANRFWLSSSNEYNTNFACFVNFFNGHDVKGLKNGSYSVRLVRGEQFGACAFEEKI